MGGPSELDGDGMTTAADDRDRAGLLVTEGNELANAREFEGAIDKYRLAAAAAPGWSVPWFNLGLRFKHLGRWIESLDANRRATDLAPAPDNCGHAHVQEGAPERPPPVHVPHRRVPGIGAPG